MKKLENGQQPCASSDSPVLIQTQKLKKTQRDSGTVFRRRLLGNTLGANGIGLDLEVNGQRQTLAGG